MIFLITLVLQRKANFPSCSEKFSIILTMIFSEISKLLLPVIASIPEKFLILDFVGILNALIFDSSDAVIHGGLPITRKFFIGCSLSFVGKVCEKISSFSRIIFA